MDKPPAPPLQDDLVSTIEAARLLGLSVRSVQLMVDRGELPAWKTPGGHRRIEREAVRAWLDGHRTAPAPLVDLAPARPAPAPDTGPVVLLIEDSRHFQNLVRLIVREWFPDVSLVTADDGISGLALAGRLRPAVLLVDIVLPGLDGAALLAGLRGHEAFAGMHCIVVTGLDEAGLAPYRAALKGVPLARKSRLALELPGLMARALGRPADAGPGADR